MTQTIHRAKLTSGRTAVLGLAGAIGFTVLLVWLAPPVPEDLRWQYDHWRSGEAADNYLVEYLGPAVLLWIFSMPLAVPLLLAIAACGTALILGAANHLRDSDRARMSAMSRSGPDRTGAG